jgi:hypothetical protein
MVGVNEKEKVVEEEGPALFAANFPLISKEGCLVSERIEHEHHQNIYGHSAITKNS